MTLEVRDVEDVHYRATGIEMAVSMTREPDPLEVELLNGWPPVFDGQTMHYEKKLLKVEVPTPETAVAMLRWLISETGLPAISARADVVREESENLLRGLQGIIQKHYDQ